MEESNKSIAESKIWSVIAASSAGTIIEWYDFYIFGSLAPILSALFFPKENPTAGLLSTLAIFATGFAVRPFGAIFFGRIGDAVGRKYAFLITLLLMGGATTIIGLLPTYDSIGIFAPMILVVLRLTQGLALGGEYGGAATYVAEHSPDGKRGFYTSFIQTTATSGLFFSLGVILAVRSFVGEEAFKVWGWRIPFLFSVVLVFFSYIIRIRLAESPIFTRMKVTGKISKNPLKDAFRNKENVKIMLKALFGAVAGQGVIWYTGQFYALYYLQTTLKIHFQTASFIVAVALLLATPFFVLFGALSDKIGRKKIIMTGCLLAAILYIPIYHAMGYFASDPLNPNSVMLSVLVFVQVIFVTMVYGPIAAYLVELFPAKIRYTSMSLPYHIGNGVFGGLVPLIGTSLVVATGNVYAGLYYPISIALLTFVVGTFYVKETNLVSLWDEVN
jgi:MFS family permease